MKLELPWVLLVAAALFVWQLDGCRQREIGELRGENKQLTLQSQRADTVYVHTRDTLRLTRTRTDSILLTDTVFTRDTVVKIVEAERKACDLLVASCETRVALRDLRIKNLEQQARGESFLGIKLPSRMAMFGLGAVGGYILAQ
jgi:hypothetical protein